MINDIYIYIIVIKNKTYHPTGKRGEKINSGKAALKTIEISKKFSNCI